MDSITVSGKKIEVKRIGPPPGEAVTLVFLHEGLGSAAQWKNFPEKLAGETGCGAFIYSRAGYGNSDPSRLPLNINFMHDEGQRVLPELIRKAGLDEYILIGHSDGGSIAVIFAGSRHTPALKGIVTEAAHLFCEDITIRSIREAKVNFETGGLREKLYRYHGKNTENAFYGWNDVWLHPDFVNWNIEEFLPGIEVPFLAIQGEDDEYGTKAQLESIARNTGEKTEISILKKCGHSPHGEKEEETLSVMKEFINRILESDR